MTRKEAAAEAWLLGFKAIREGEYRPLAQWVRDEPDGPCAFVFDGAQPCGHGHGIAVNGRFMRLSGRPGGKS